MNNVYAEGCFVQNILYTLYLYDNYNYASPLLACLIMRKRI
jgi:hypothetical protein